MLRNLNSSHTLPFLNATRSSEFCSRRTPLRLDFEREKLFKPQQNNAINHGKTNTYSLAFLYLKHDQILFPVFPIQSLLLRLPVKKNALDWRSFHCFFTIDSSLFFNSLFTFFVLFLHINYSVNYIYFPRNKFWSYMLFPKVGYRGSKQISILPCIINSSCLRIILIAFISRCITRYFTLWGIWRLIIVTGREVLLCMMSVTCIDLDSLIFGLHYVTSREYLLVFWSWWFGLPSKRHTSYWFLVLYFFSILEHTGKYVPMIIDSNPGDFYVNFFLHNYYFLLIFILGKTIRNGDSRVFDCNFFCCMC